MLNLQICTVIIMTKKKHKNIIKKNNKENSCDSRDSNPGSVGSKFIKISTTVCRLMQFIDRNNQYMLKL